uniref:Uncharacterized protein n=1 Tax=Arion vulgaris TaxID=1028688 RepID=A0A0B7AR27_9EUPU
MIQDGMDGFSTTAAKFVAYEEDKFQMYFKVKMFCSGQATGSAVRTSLSKSDVTSVYSFFAELYHKITQATHCMMIISANILHSPAFKSSC